MRVRVLFFSLFLASVILITHCSLSDLLPVEGKIFFRVSETYGSYDCNCAPDIALTLTTEKAYSSLGYQIKTELFCSGWQVDVKILGIMPPDGPSPPAFGPASAAKVLDLQEGTYALNLTYKYAVDRYHLTVETDSLHVISAVPSFSKPEFALFWRYPKNSFVYLCGTMTETSWICDDFLSRLLKEVDLEEFHFPEYGEIPYPRSSEGHYYDAPARYFRYPTEGDFDRAGQVLKTYSADVISHYDGVSLWLWNWKNRAYRSWPF